MNIFKEHEARLSSLIALVCDDGNNNWIIIPETSTRTETNPKLIRQPKFCEIKVVIGKPKTVAIIKPARTIDAAFPLESGGTNVAEKEMATPKAED